MSNRARPSMRVKIEQDGNPIPNIQNDGEGKRRRYAAPKTNETNNAVQQQGSSSTSDGSIVFKIINQPESQHRARYQTEGSRGAIKDRSGTGFPTLKLEGCRRPVKIQIFIGNDVGKVSPHMFYQVCRVTGKNSNPCEEKKIDGTDIIEITSELQTDMTIICDCVGILKERFADVEARFPKHKNWKNSKKKSTKCRLVFRTTVENSRGEPESLQVVSDVINCTQLPGTPEILKMSASTSDLKGGGELWIIGKNFLKDTKVVFTHSIPGKKEPLWTKLTEPEQEYFHQTHLITQIPPFYNLDTQEDIEISVFIKCGEKLSDPLPFTYNPSPAHYMLPPPHANSHDVSLPRGVAAPAVAINQQFAKTGSVSVITGCAINTNGESQPHLKPTILEHLYDHQNKKSKIDYNNKNSRRTRSVPRPNLINEDTVFVSEGNTKKENMMFTNFSQFPWKEISRASEIQSSYNTRIAQVQSIHEPLLKAESIYKPEIVVPQQNGSAKRSFSIEEDSNTCNFTKDSFLDESSLSPTRADFSSSLTTDFSNAFSFKRNQICETGTTMSFSGVILPQPSENAQQPITFDQTTPNTVIHKDPAQWKLKPNVENVAPLPDKTYSICANEKKPEANSEYPNVSVKASSDEKATISISLPTSILKDQKHFQNVIETINNTLLNKHPPHEDEQTIQDVNKPNYSASICSQTSANPQWPNSTMEQKPLHQVESDKNDAEWNNTVPVWIQESTQHNIQQDPKSPNRKITSMPVSVLSNTRKRNFSSEPLVQSTLHTSTEIDLTDAAMNTPAYQENINSCKSPTAILSNPQVQPVHALEENCPMQILSQSKKNNDFNYQLSVNTDISTEKIAETYPSNSNNLLTKPVSPNSTASNNVTYENSPLQWQPTTNPTAQEKKWNAEFNEVLQTVIEENKETKMASMDWSSNNEQKIETMHQKEALQETKKQTMDWNPVPEIPKKDPLMDWCSGKQVPQLKLSSNVESFIVVDQHISNSNGEDGFQTKFQGKEAGLNLPVNNFTTIMVNSSNIQPASIQLASENLQIQPGSNAVYYEQKPKINTFQGNKQILQNSAPSQEPSKAPESFLVSGLVMNGIQTVDQFASQVPLNPVEEFAKRSPPNNFQSYNSAPSIQEDQNTQKEVIRSEVILFDESLVQIQGDPLLSETSSVIGMQKNIENASLSSPDPTVNVFKQGSEIPCDQQWAITTPQNNEWTYNSAT